MATYDQTDNSYQSAGNRTLTGFFDSRSDAEDALMRLRDAGIADANIRLIPGSDPSGQTTASDDDRGFFGALKDFFMPDDDRETYAEGLRRGGYLITVTGLGGDQYDTALDILDDEGSVDMNAREETWRSEGWAGHSTSGSGSGMTSGRLAETGGTLGDATDDRLVPPTAGIAPTSTDPTLDIGQVGTTGTTMGTQSGMDRTTAMGTGRDLDEEVIPLAEERIRVGKRDVSHGRVRVRSYVVETPVNEQVNLREEHVQVDRRPVDRAATAGDDLFRERTIEAEEHAEEAVVSKDVRVREEVALRRDQTERNETISDNVRRTEVEVEDERTGEWKNANPRRA
jgi:uncharacterized protein (TIGR02271 family)